MLCEDTASEQTRLFNAGVAAGVPAPEGGAVPAPVTLAHCVRGHGHHDDDDDDDNDEGHAHKQ